MDASEPDILSNADMDYRKQLMHPTALGASALHFNAYGLMNAKGIYEGQRSVNDSSRVFILTRSGYAGSQRFAAAVWSGDIGTRWEDMKPDQRRTKFFIQAIPIGLWMRRFLIGKTFERAREDRMTWKNGGTRAVGTSLGLYCLCFAATANTPTGNLEHCSRRTSAANHGYYSELRYRLHLIYTMAGRCYLDDYTIMRP